MLALMKKHPINDIAKVAWHGKIYAVPVKIIKKYEIKAEEQTHVSPNELFRDLTDKSGEVGILLKGLRYREGLTQMELAKKLNIGQANLSAMENGRRNVGKELAKKIADLFGLDYRIFL